MQRLFVLVVLVVLGTASKCNPGPMPVVDAAPVPVMDAAPTPVPVIPSCATACAHGASLGCSWAQPTPKGATCVTVCTNAAATVPWDVVALTSATTCN